MTGLAENSQTLARVPKACERQMMQADFNNEIWEQIVANSYYLTG